MRSGRPGLPTPSRALTIFFPVASDYRLLRGRYAAGSRHKGRNFSRVKLWARSMPISRGVVLVSFGVRTRPFVFSVTPINSSPFGARSVGEKRWVLWLSSSLYIYIYIYIYVSLSPLSLSLSLSLSFSLTIRWSWKVLNHSVYPGLAWRIVNIYSAVLIFKKLCTLSHNSILMTGTLTR